MREPGADRDDTSIPVKNTDSFAASGDIWIGLEAIHYTSKTGGGSPSFDGCSAANRGLYSQQSANFAYTHRVHDEFDQWPLVTTIPTVITGRRAALSVGHPTRCGDK